MIYDKHIDIKLHLDIPDGYGTQTDEELKQSLESFFISPFFGDESTIKIELLPTP